MAAKVVTLFYGDNGLHEFFQSDDKEAPFVIKVPNSDFWTCFDNCLVMRDGHSTPGSSTKVLGSPDLNEALAILTKKTGFEFVFSSEKEWVFTNKHKTKMHLVKSKKANFSILNPTNFSI